MSDVIEAKLPDAESTTVPSVQEAAEVAPPARPEYEELIYRGQFEMKEISPFFNLRDCSRDCRFHPDDIIAGVIIAATSPT
jgi:hypothetical protein